MLFFSCKKDKQEGLSNNITGTWNQQKTTYIETEYINDAITYSDTVVTSGHDGEFLSIISTGEAWWRTWNGTGFNSLNTKYTRSGSSLIIGEGGDIRNFTIIKLDDAYLTIEEKTQYSSANRKFMTHTKYEFKK